MNKAYLVGHITVTNPQAYTTYAEQVPKTIEAYGGKYLVRGGTMRVLEGQPQDGRHVVIEFADRETAQAWYSSDAYQAIIQHRTNNSTGTLLLIDGYQP
jgi:uncharacterized protein (DUF1330 family)